MKLILSNKKKDVDVDSACKSDSSLLSYVVYVPGGNDTALVEKLNYIPEIRKAINDRIMSSNSSIEQVGFVEKGVLPLELIMAGGEFCANATRSAAFYYLEGRPGTLKIKVNDDFVNAGVYENGDAWCEIPLYYGGDVITKLKEGTYRVKMNGMVSLIINEETSKPYLYKKERIKEEAMLLINNYDLGKNDAVGVMFLEREGNNLKINPIVWVKSINTLFYETACGSGTTAAAMVQAYLNSQNQSLEILQPSGQRITAQIEYCCGKITKARISGAIKTDCDRKFFYI